MRQRQVRPRKSASSFNRRKGTKLCAWRKTFELPVVFIYGLERGEEGKKRPGEIEEKRREEKAAKRLEFEPKVRIYSVTPRPTRDISTDSTPVKSKRQKNFPWPPLLSPPSEMNQHES